MLSAFKSSCRLAKASQIVRIRTGFQNFSWQPVFVPRRDFCETEEGDSPTGKKIESVYVGNPHCDLRCDKGECWDKFGNYNGDSASDVTKEHGVLTYANGIVYEGELIDDEPNGQGKITWVDGMVYEGTIENGILSDDTRLVSVSGVYMEGNCANRFLNGNGKIIIVLGNVVQEDDCEENKVAQKDVTVYEGEFKGSLLNGRGKITYSDGMYQAGMFVNNRLHGMGRITAPDGFYVEAEFDMGVIRGWCKAVSADGTMEGTRVNGKFVGPVKTTNASGVVSEGDYTDGAEHGLWRMYRLSIDNQEVPIAQGHYHHGVRQGPWTFTLPGGETFDVVF